MNSSDPRLTDYPQSLILPGVRLQEAIKKDAGIAEAFDTYCRRGYRLPNSGAQVSTFLVTTFQGDAEKLLQYVTIDHLVAELAAGAHVLASIAAEHWDRNSRVDQLKDLAQHLVDSWSASLENTEAIEFSLALSTAIAILHPDVAARLLNHCEPAAARDPKLSDACADAREWQKSGELIAQATPDQQVFWHQQLIKRGGDWIWDTDEARKAVRALESANPDGAAQAKLLVERIPGWAWNIRVQPPAPKAEASPAKAPLTRKPALLFTTLKWAAAVLLGVGLGALWNSTQVRHAESISTLATAVVPHEASPSTVVAASPEVPAPETPADITASPAPAPTEAVQAPLATEAPRPVMAALPKTPDSSEPPAPVPSESPAPAINAQPLPVQKGSRPGWVRSPLNEEFEITAANTKDGRISDPSDRVWTLPAELASAATSSPMPAQAAAVADITPPVVPPPPPSAPALAPLPAPAAPEQPGVPGPTDKPATPVPSEPAPQAPPTTTPAPVPVETPSPAPATPPVTPEKPATPFNLHPDYFKTSTQTAAAKAPTKKTPTKSSTSKASAKPVAETRSSDRIYVTRANSIRLRYRDGIWTSSPGAYLKDTAPSSQEWARDMTLRERSSGSIPPDYKFQVLRDGTVQVVPEGRKR